MGRVTLISGPPGSGKSSALVAELLRLSVEWRKPFSSFAVALPSASSSRQFQRTLIQMASQRNTVWPAILSWNDLCLDLLNALSKEAPFRLISTASQIQLWVQTLHCHADSSQAWFGLTRSRDGQSLLWRLATQPQSSTDAKVELLGIDKSQLEAWLSQVRLTFESETIPYRRLTSYQCRQLLFQSLVQDGFPEQVKSQFSPIIVEDIHSLETLDCQILAALADPLDIILTETPSRRQKDVTPLKEIVPPQAGWTEIPLQTSQRGNIPLLQFAQSWLEKEQLNSAVPIWQQSPLSSSENLNSFLSFGYFSDEFTEAEHWMQWILGKLKAFPEDMWSAIAGRIQIVLPNSRLLRLYEDICQELGLPYQASPETFHFYRLVQELFCLLENFYFNNADITADILKHPANYRFAFLLDKNKLEFTDFLDFCSTLDPSLTSDKLFLATYQYFKNTLQAQLTCRELDWMNALERLTQELPSLTIELLRQQSEALWRVVSNQSVHPCGIRLILWHEFQNDESDWVVLPGLSEAVLEEHHHDFLSLDQHAKNLSAELLLKSFLAARRHLFLSTHRIWRSQQTAAAQIFVSLMSQYSGLDQSEKLSSLCALCESSRESDIKASASCQFHFCDKQSMFKLDLAKKSPNKYLGQSTWSNLSKSIFKNVYGNSETIQLSPTSISLYAQCPRKYYFKEILKLKEQTDPEDAASIGVIIHDLMEAFNRDVPGSEQSAQSLKTLAESLFSSHPNSIGPSFRTQTIERLVKLDKLGATDLSIRLMSAISDLSQKGYFGRAISQVIPEKSYIVSNLPDMNPRCSIKARLDALIEYADGSWEIVDYKFYGPNQFSQTRPESRQEALAKVLSPIPKEASTHQQRFSDAANRYYQLPLYYLIVSLQEPEIFSKITKVRLQIIRPQFQSNPSQGAISVELPADLLESSIQSFKQDIETYIITPILTNFNFEPSPDRHCDYCFAKSLCDARIESLLPPASNYSEEET
jgi:hypothetical protein